MARYTDVLSSLHTRVHLAQRIHRADPWDDDARVWELFMKFEGETLAGLGVPVGDHDG